MLGAFVSMQLAIEVTPTACMHAMEANKGTQQVSITNIITVAQQKKR
jgi:hypothetical protein